MSELPVAPPDVATRALCAAAYVDPAFAAEAEGMLLGDGLSAIGPPVGLSLPILLQHVEHSMRIRRYRDRALILCWLMAGFCVLGPLLITRGTKDFAPTIFGVLCGAGSVAALAWTVGTTARWLRVHTATAILRTSRSPLTCAPPLKPDVHGEIVQDQGSNVVCYSGAAPSPFVGFGEPVDEKVIVTLPVAMVPEGGKHNKAPRATTPIDSTDLHIYLRQRLLEASGVRGLEANSLLFVRGDAANGVKGLWPQGMSTRPSRQAHALIYSAGINDPGDRAQTYLTLQTVRHGGMLVVTMHVRIREEHGRLSLEIASVVAAPLAAKYLTAGSLPRTQRGLRAHARWYALIELPVALTDAWLGPVSRFYARRRRLAERMEKLRGIHGGKMPDRGAPTSVRRWTMDTAKMQYQEEVDARDVLQRLRKAVFDHLMRYFEDHGIDTAELLRVRDNHLIVDMKFPGEVIEGARKFGANQSI